MLGAAEFFNDVEGHRDEEDGDALAANMPKMTVKPIT